MMCLETGLPSREEGLGPEGMANRNLRKFYKDKHKVLNLGCTSDQFRPGTHRLDSPCMM